MKKTNKELRTFGSNLSKGFLVGFTIAIASVGIYAVAVSGTFNTFTSGGVMKSTDINANFATLKAAIEGIPTQKSWRLIYENDVTSATGSISASGFDGDSDIEYMIVVKVIGAATGSGDFLLEVNGDNTTCNYKVFHMWVVQAGTPSNSTPACPSGAGMFIASTAGSSITAGTVFVSKLLLFSKAGTGTKRVAHNESGKALSTSESWYSIGTTWWENTSSNITSMRFFYTNGNGFGSGSRIEVWAKR